MGGFFSGYGWQDWADIILKIKADDEKIYNCAKDLIEDFTQFEENFISIYESTPCFIVGTDYLIKRPEYDTMSDCEASWTTGKCEGCGNVWDDYYPNCSVYQPLFSHYAGPTNDCENCNPMCPNALHIEVSYNFLKDSGLLSLMYN